jgi:hypothetical protein
MKLLHNFFRLFHKDDGAHFSYNLGVGFMRLSAAVFVIFVLLVLYAYFLPRNTLEYYDSVKATVVSTDRQVHEHRSSRASRTLTYTYTADFSGTYSDGTNFTLEQYVTESQYQAYTAIQGNYPIPMTLYKTSSDGEYFLSKNTHHIAVKEYRTSNPTLRLKSTTIKIAAWWVLFAAAVFATAGCHEIRVSMKYPRTDIPPTIDNSYEKNGGTAQFIEDKAMNERK